MRKLFETLAAACLALALLPMTALADGATLPDWVEASDGTYTVKNGKTSIKLGGDVALTDKNLAIDKNVSLDLAGYTLTLMGLNINKDCELTLTDSSTERVGTIRIIPAEADIIPVHLAGTLRANGGTIEDPTSSVAGIAVESAGSIVCDGSTPTDFSIMMTLAEGTIGGGNFKSRVVVLNPGGSITGGTFEQYIGVLGGTLSISGGTFEGEIFGSSVDISGGTFEGKVSGSSVDISGGTFYGDIIDSSCTIAEGSRKIAFKNGGDIYATEVVASGKKTAEPRALEKEHFTFGGWLDESGALYEFGSTLAADVTLHAKWTPHRYNIHYELNGGSLEGKSAPATHTYGTETQLASPKREGYTFDGWYTNAGFAGAAVRALGATDYTGDVTLYAKWVSVDELDYRWYDESRMQGEEGSKYYVISNAAQLRGLANLVNGTVYDDGLGRTDFKDKTVRLAADIDLAGIADWVPIGSVGGNESFRGVFDGDGKTVSNLEVDSDAPHGAAGLFGYTVDATVKNLSVSGSVEGMSHVGGIVGGLSGGEIENCSFSGSVRGAGNYVGGIVGIAHGAVSRCSNHAAVSSDGDYAHVGGIAGEAHRDVRYCCNRGEVGSDGDYACVGGIAGFVYPLEDVMTMRSCYSVGAVSATGAGASVGGAVGYVEDFDFRLTVDGVYYLEGSAPRGIGATFSGEHTSGAGAMPAGTAGDAEGVTAAAFSGGEAAWLLQGAADEGDGLVWGQAIGADACPVLGGDAVCRVVFKVDGEDDLVKYVNVGGTVGVSDPAAPPTVPAGYAFAGWYTEAAGGAEFELDSAVTEDITLYARWIDVAAPAEPGSLPGDVPAESEPPTGDVLANTGDDAHAAAWLALLLASACAMIAAAVRARRRGGAAVER